MPSSTLLSLALLASTSFALPTLTTPPSSSAASPSPSSLASFTCTPFDFSQTNNFGGSSPNTFLADLLSFSLDTNQVVVVGFDPSSPNSTLGQVAETAQGNGSWGFEVCTGFEGIDTSSTTPGIWSVFGHVTYVAPNTTTVSCVSISTPNATDYSHLSLIASPCENTSAALANQRGQVWNLINYESNEDSLFLLGPGPAGYNVSYSPGPASFLPNTTTGLDLVPTGGSSFSKFFFQKHRATTV